MTDIPVIETERLTLRGPQLDDHKALCAYYRGPRSQWNGGPRDAAQVHDMIVAVAGNWLLRGYGLWFITSKESGDFFGFAGIMMPRDWPEPELGYGLVANAEGKGIAFEAVTAARDACAGMFGLHRLVSYPAPDNTRSKTLLARMGATYETTITLRDHPAEVWRHSEVCA